MTLHIVESKILDTKTHEYAYSNAEKFFCNDSHKILVVNDFSRFLEDILRNSAIKIKCNSGRVHKGL